MRIIRVCPKCKRGDYTIRTTSKVDVSEWLSYVTLHKNGRANYEVGADGYPDYKPSEETKLTFQCGYCGNLYKSKNIDDLAHEMIEEER